MAFLGLKTKKRKVIAITALSLVAIITSLIFILTGCSSSKFSSKPPLLSEQSSTMLELPTDGSTPADHAPNENVYYAFTAMSKLNSFVGKTSGKTVTKVAFADVNQYIKANRVVLGNEVFKQSVSHSSFKGVGAQTYVNGDNYIIRNASKVSSVDDVKWEAGARKVTEDSFISLYGYVPSSLTGYVMTDETIISSEYLGEEDGIYTFTYKLNPETATAKLRMEMRTMAGTKSYPIFSNASLTVKMDSSWRVIETVTDSKYQVDMLGGVTCTESVTEVFSAWDESTPIPDGELFRSYVDEEVSEPVIEEPTALDYLMDGFSDYITGSKPIKAALSVSSSNSNIPLSLRGKVEVNVNMENLSALSVRAAIDEISYDDISFNDLFVGYQDETVYLRAGNFKARGTVDEITALIGRILTLLDVEMPELDGMLSSIDASSLLSDATLERANGVATVTLPLSFGGINADVELLFADGDKISFVGATAKIEGITATITPDDTLSIEHLGSGYYSIANILNVIDENGEINVKATIGETVVDACVNLSDMTVIAKTSIFGNDLYIKLLDEKLYLSYLGLNAFVAIDEIDDAMAKLQPIIGDKLDLSAFENINVDDVLSSISVTDGDCLTIAASLLGFNASVIFNTDNDELTLNSITLSSGELNLSVVPSQKANYEMPDASYYNLLSLLDVIDENGNVALSINVSGTTIEATINLYTLQLFATVAGAEIMADVNAGVAYLRYPGINATVRFDELEYILNKIKPIIEKFAGESAISSFDFGAIENLDLEQLISSIIVTEDENSLTLSMNLNGIDVAAAFNTEQGSLRFDLATVSIEGVEIIAEHTDKALAFDFDLDDSYIDLKALVDTFGDALVDIFTSNSISVSLSGALTSGSTTYNVKAAEIKIDGLDAAPRARADLTLEIATTEEDGTVSSTTHTIRLIYLDPSLVAEGATNVYFTYDSSLDNVNGEANPIEGTFTTTKATETLDILKEIYKYMPELQEALGGFLVADEDGNPTLPKLDVDIASLLNSVSFDDATLAIDVNGNALLKALPSSIVATLAVNDSALVAGIPSLTMGSANLNLALSLMKPADDVITDETFEYTLDGNEIDFSSVNDLLEMLANTAKFRSFDITGNIGMSIGSWNIAKDAIDVRVQLDVIEKKTYTVITITRNPTSVLFTSVWKDYKGVSTIYIDPVNEMIYVHHQYTTKSGIIITKYTEHEEYESHTIEEFTANLLPNVMNIIRLNTTIEGLIPTDTSSNDHVNTATVENTLLGYTYNGTDTLKLKLNLEPLIGDVQNVEATIKHDSDKNIASLNATVGLVKVINLSLDAQHNAPYNTYQNTYELIMQQASSGNY